MISEEVARAFTVKMMSHDKISEMRMLESTLHPNECFTSWQIAKHFLEGQRMEIEPVEIHTMNKLWFDFYSRILYPQRLAEEDLHPKGCTIPGCDHQSEACPDPLHPEGCTMFSCRHPWNDQCKSKAQEMWQWEDFVLQFYRPPAQGKTVAAELGLV